MRGHLEREIRLLPQVLACTVSEGDVVVLVPPAADPSMVEQAVLGVLADDGEAYEVSVIGGTPEEQPPSGAVARATRSPALLVGSLIATAALALSSLIVGLGRDDAPTAGQPTTVATPSADVGSPVPSPSEPPVSEPSAGATSTPREPSVQPSSKPPQVLGQQVIRGSASPSSTT